jgi:hypothetical protein
MELPVDQEDIALFNAATQVHVGNGSKVIFWTSRWLDGEAPASLFLALFRHSRRKNRTLRDGLSEDKWIRDVDYNMTEQMIVEFVSLWSYLHNIELSLWSYLCNIELSPQQEDTIIWLHTSDGQYTAKSAYNLQFLGMTTSITVDTTWKTKAPPKCRFFTWLMLQKRIWTAARLQLREWPNDYFCQLCLRNLETTAHLFQDCPFTVKVWDSVGRWIGISAVRPENWDQTQDLGLWFTSISNSGRDECKDGVRSLVMLTA